MNLLTRENVTLAIAIIGCLLSLWNFFKDLYHNRLNISVACYASLDLGDYYFVKIAFINNSTLPVTITRIRIQSADLIYEAAQESLSYYEYSYPDRRGRSGERTACVPIGIESFGYKSVVLHFVKSKFHYPSNPVKMIISTNRGEERVIIRFPKTIETRPLSFLQRLE